MASKKAGAVKLGVKKLSAAQVAEIIRLEHAKEMDRDDIAEKFGVSEVYVGQLAYETRRPWRAEFVNR